MVEKIIAAGSGGQGIMLLGKILAEAAVREGKHVTWLPAYGPEVRGGTAHCMTVISDAEIGSPYINKADTLIIMNNPSLERFGRRVEKGGLCIINSSLAEDAPPVAATALRQPFTDIAIELGNIKVANMVALGFFVGKREIVALDSVLEVIEEIAPADKKHLVQINQQALLKGQQLALGSR
ncbi:MAG TPA: 2-oxoacid:acceptor oxidoreductase family protein [Patescibacteria group bacterium]|nr:2-oxoacid:acceptor oxidoreductase family protein [Patescibacteria group bacterium]